MTARFPRPAFYSFFLIGALIASPLSSLFAQTVRINEFQSSNGQTIPDEDGDFSDWVELLNYGVDPVDLTGFGLTDNPSNPFKWEFQASTIAPGEHLIVWASGKNRQPVGRVAAGILREVYNDINGTHVSDLINHPRYPDSPSSKSVITNLFEAPSNVGDNYGQRMHGWIRPPVSGDYVFYIASDDGSALYLSTDDSPDNVSLIASVPEFTNFREWNKYVSQTSVQISLVADQLYYISALMKEGGFGDHLSVGWQFPDSSLQRPINGTNLFRMAELHTSWSLSAAGEPLQLTDPATNIVDSAPSIAVPRDMSYGRSTADSNVWHFFATPTPGAANSTPGYPEIAASPVISIPAGMYTSAITLTVTSSTPGAVVRYTLDGSEPTESSPVLQEAMIAEGFDGGTNNPPSGWTFNAIGVYTDSGSVGQKPPSLRFDTTGASVTTPLFSGATNAAFMIKGQSINAASTFVLEGLIDADWVALTTFNNISTSKTVVAVSLATNITRLRFVYNKVASGNLAFDDFLLTGLDNQPLPITLASRAGQTNGISMINTSSESVGPPFYNGWEPPLGEVFKIHTLRVKAFKTNAWPSRPLTHSYLIDTAAANRYSLPVISIAADQDHFFSNQTGIYVPGWYNNYFQDGSAWERPGSMEMFEADGSLAFRIEAGIRIHGGSTRSRARKSLRIYARNPTSMEYQLFPDKSVSTFDTFILRNGGNDWGQFVFRDDFMQSLVNHTDLDRQHTRLSVVFVNGEYWGLHPIRDRFDDGYIENHYGLGETEFGQIETFTDGSNSYFAYDRGDPAMLADFQDLFAFINNPGVVNSANYAAVADRMDIANFIDYYTAQIYFGNTDWPGNNNRSWRSVATNRAENAPYRHDGRWRWLLFDTDFGYGLNFNYVPGNNQFADHNTLAFAAHPTGTHFSNGTNATLMLRRLLANNDFKRDFILRFSDHLNSAFKTDRVTNQLNAMIAQVDPEMTEHVNRWRQPYNWNSEKQRMRDYAHERTDAVWGHIQSYFSLGARSNITVNVADAVMGHVRVNTLDITADLPGIASPAYPWTGSYFTDYPVTLTAVPAPGFRFTGWFNAASDLVSASTSYAFTPGTQGMLTAQFEEEDTIQLIHYWNFNTPNPVLSVSFTIGGGALTVETTAATNILQDAGQNFFGENARFGDPVGTHFRLNWPLVGTNIFSLPTTGFTNIIVKYETRRSGQGAGLQIVETTTDGSTYQFYTNVVVVDGTPVLQTFDFSSAPAVNNNPDFGLRIRFEQGDGSTGGNNRFDNFTVEGWPIPGENFPPAPLAIPLQEAIELGSSLVFDADDYFTDADPLTYTVSSDLTNKAGVSIAGSTVTLVPLERGEAAIALVANDGVNAPVTNTFRVLVYPRAHAVADGAFTFGTWNPDTPERVYPEHMLFLQSDRNDTLIDTPLVYAYHIAHNDYHANDQGTVGFPYNNTGRSRINGLNDDGIAFINTGSNRDLGGAVLALDTRSVTNVAVAWTGGTVLPNVRVYAIRLQYRTGHTGEWSDVLDDASQPVEYVRNAATGHSTNLPAVNLPAGLLELPYVQVLWRYYLISGASGARAQLRLDDIAVTAATEPVEFQRTYPSMFLRGTFNNWAGDTPMTLIADYLWEVTATFTNDSNPRYKFEVSGGNPWSTNYGDNNADGFGDLEGANITITEGNGIYRIQFNDLTKAYTATKLAFGPIFIPGVTASWSVNGNWVSGTYPNAPGAMAIINQPESGNRNVDLTEPITVGELVINNGDSPYRNRIRGQTAGNSLTFSATNGPAQLTITGDGTGFVEFEVVGGMVLATDLVVSVTNILGDAEYGALRMRTAWTGPGGLRKTGPGMASLTGTDKGYAGTTIVEQGVLAVSQPSTMTNNSSVSVLPGGQLRLTSANDENGARLYSFGGGISLNSLGRGSEVPDAEGYGVLGALRYEPGAGTNLAVINSPVAIEGPSGIHVSTEPNSLYLSGALSGSHPHAIVKTGGGSLGILDAAHTFSGGIIVSNGQLRLAGAQLPGSYVLLSPDTSMSGIGRVAFVEGHGRIILGGGSIMDISGVWGLNYTFVFNTNGLPTYSDPANSVNDLLRMRSATPFIQNLTSNNHVDLYLNVEPPSNGDSFYGGFFTDAPIDFTDAVAMAHWSIYVRDPSGTNFVNGESFSLYDNVIEWTATTELTVADFEDGTVTGRVLRLQFGTSALTPFQSWQADNFSEAELLNDSISGPMADPEGSGAANLFRYASGLDRNADPVPALPRAEFGDDDGPRFIYRRLIDPLSGVLYTVELTISVGEEEAWREVEALDGIDEVDTTPTGDGITEEATLSVPVELIDSELFLRLKITMDE